MKSPSQIPQGEILSDEFIKAFRDIIGRLEPGIVQSKEPDERHDENLGALILDKAGAHLWRQRHHR